MGSEVAVGQTLYVLDLRPYDAEVARAKADVSQADANLEFARHQVGAQDCKSCSRLNGVPSALLIVYLAPGANAVESGNRVREFLETAKKNFPAGIDYKISYDTTNFVRAAIQDRFYS